MSEKTKLNWKPEDNNYLNSVLNFMNLCLAFMIILAPIITSLFCLVGFNMDVLNVYVMFFVFYIFVRVFYYALNFRFIKFRKMDLLEILAIALFAMLFACSLINKAVNMAYMYAIEYFFVFLTFIKVDKKHYKTLLYTFVLTITACSIMGLCDLHNAYMPGFDKDNPYTMAMQFCNPNYSGYITTMAVLMCMYVLVKYKTVSEQIIFWISYVVLNVALFINGCFSAETAMFAGELFLIIYLWIKNKKCPWIVLGCTLISIISSFIRIDGVSTSSANYLYEFLAVVDNNLGTHLLKSISTLFNKLFGTPILESVAGSDGWDRGAFKKEAFNIIVSSPRSFLFGNGAGYNYNVLVHNVWLQVGLEYGVINLGLYLSILIITFVRLFKTNFSSYNVFLIATIFATVVISHYFGCLDPYSFTYFAALFACFSKEISDKYSQKKNLEKGIKDGNSK